MKKYNTLQAQGGAADLCPAAPVCISDFPQDFIFFAGSEKMKFVNEIRKSTIFERTEYVPFRISA